MQAVQGNGASVPVSDPPSSIPIPYRYSSRSNSVSSASITTVKRTASFGSSGTGSRNSFLPMPVQNPGDTSLIALRVGREQLPPDAKRRSSVAIDASERPSSNAFGAHSTSRPSSVVSAGATRSRTSSGALLAGSSNPDYPSKRRSSGMINYSPRTSVQAKQLSSPSSRVRESPAGSPQKQRTRTSRSELASPLNSLPPLQAAGAPSESASTVSPSTIHTTTTPSTQTSGGMDYFSDGTTSPYRNIQTQSPGRSRPVVPSASVPLSAVDGAADLEPTRSDVPPQSFEAPRGNQESSSESQANGVVKDESRPKTSRPRGRGEREKKDMLSKALHKANTAVVLDNAQNFEGALEAYSDACTLLRLVMNRSTGADDKRKLDAIRSTYIARIEELHQMQMDMGDGADEKALPPRPTSEDDPFITAAPAGPPLQSTLQAGTGPDAMVAAEPVQPAYKEHRAGVDTSTGHAYTNGLLVEPPLKPTNYMGESPDQPSIGQRDLIMDRAVSAGVPAAVPLPLKTTNLHLPTPESNYIPAPLSPKRGQSPTRGHDFDDEATLPPNLDASSDQIAWLDTIREDGSSRGSSVHSVSSQQGLHRKHLRTASGISNPDFDAAFDAAVEAAYDEGLEPDLESVKPRDIGSKGHAYNGSSQVRSSEIVEITSPITYAPRLGDPILGADEEEERILDDIARDYGAAFIFDRSTKSALPRQSDSSGYSRSTWQSSQVSDRTTAGTSLSTVTEDVKSVSPSHNAFTTSASINSMLAVPPPPLTAPPPQMSLPTPPTGNQNRASGVRNRRLSGQNPKQLKIETPGAPDVRKRASTVHQESSSSKTHDVSPPEFDHDFKFGGLLGPVAFEDTQRGDMLKAVAPPDLGSPISESERPTTATSPDYRQSLESDDLRLHYPPMVKKNRSAMSLREHRVLLSSPTFDTGPSLATPLSSTFMNFGSKRNIDTPLTSQRATLPSVAGTAAEGKYADILLFDTTVSDAQRERPLSNRSTSIPTGVEPCPESFLLRPFWLMRNIHTSLTHPKGAFLTSKLFVPREVWQTRGVKLKSVEEKIAQLDLLSAALGSLAEVNTLDAEAVMVELQNFEDVMERVQAALSKRLGGEVGVGGLPGLFREASYGNLSASSTAKTSLISDAISVAKGREGGGAGGKGYLASWRKLRSKSSGAPVPGIGNSNIHNNSKGGFPNASEKEAFDLPSVPMTSWYAVEQRRGAQKREQVRNNNNSLVSNEGPQREYVNSLVRLFDGVRILDQIARQVEDPGLRAQSTTHVSMELSVRHAAEFFAFYVCRFVLADLGVLLDKFIKRGTEWVQA